MKLRLVKSKGIILNTKDAYCKDNIEITPFLESKTIRSNGEYTVSDGYAGLEKVIVNVPDKKPKLQEKTVIENGTYVPDEGYDGISKIIVANPIMGSNISYETEPNDAGGLTYNFAVEPIQYRIFTLFDSISTKNIIGSGLSSNVFTIGENGTRHLVFVNSANTIAKFGEITVSGVEHYDYYTRDIEMTMPSTGMTVINEGLYITLKNPIDDVCISITLEATD